MRKKAIEWDTREMVGERGEFGKCGGHLSSMWRGLRGTLNNDY
jgi:hypothetical protein